MAFCVLLSPILSVRPRQASTYALAPHTLAPHTVLSSIDNSDPLLNPACGLGIPGWVPGELVPGVMSSGGFNGTGSFTAQDFKGHTRCVSVVADVHRMAQKKLPVVVWFHGVTDDATVLEGVRGEMNGAEHGCAFRGDTEANSLASLTFESDFALLCPEASRFDPTQSSPPVDQAWNEDLITLWEIPSEMSSAGGGTPCNDTDSRDLAFLEAMLGALDPTRFDLSRIYVAGESAGGSMALYAATCLRQRGTSGVQAVAVHSAGLKVKGDNVTWPRHWSDDYSPGECPGCESYPIVPQRSEALSGMKLCVFDGTQDIEAGMNFTRSSLNLAYSWPHGVVEQHWHGRGHCFIVLWSQIANCLGDNLTQPVFVPRQFDLGDQHT